MCHLQGEHVQSSASQHATLEIVVLSGCSGVANGALVRTINYFEIPHGRWLMPILVATRVSQRGPMLVASAMGVGHRRRWPAHVALMDLCVLESLW